MGRLLLEGGAEFGGAMAEPDRRAIQIAGGEHALICVLPTAAAPDQNHQNAGRNALHWFRGLGASNVRALPVIDRESAAREDLAAELSAARLIYLLGGFPAYLAQTLSGSLCWRAVLHAYQQGAVLGGSSAGAMVLCQYLYDPERDKVIPGLDILSGLCVLPHHASFGKRWARTLVERLPGITILGIDERTGALDDAPAGMWTVYGQGQVTLYQNGEIASYFAGQVFRLNTGGQD
jgi:cyanophycinase